MRINKSLSHVVRNIRPHNRKALLRHGQQPLPNTPSNQYFSSVVPGGPADRAGIREGDYIIEDPIEADPMGCYVLTAPGLSVKSRQSHRRDTGVEGPKSACRHYILNAAGTCIGGPANSYQNAPRFPIPRCALQIDGQDVKNACHEDAVECIKNCGDSLIIRVMSVYKTSGQRQLNGRSELYQTPRTYRRRRQSDIVCESSSSSSTSSNSINSDSEIVVRASEPSIRKKLPISQYSEKKWREPLGADARSRSRDRRIRHPSVRAQSYSVGKDSIRLNAISPAARSQERVYVFEKIDGKANSSSTLGELQRTEGCLTEKERCEIRRAFRYLQTMPEGPVRPATPFILGNQSESQSTAQRKQSRSPSSGTESEHLNHVHSVVASDCLDSGGEAASTVRPGNKDITSKTSSSSGHAMQPFHSSFSVGCLQRI
ncbi:unnamed protein product, partial [Hydatigera taeniaeformis]|uniref:PDZ_6 domain-containing protein n=1 Tax=Hydatigena taeniaeformis TaxID=6205 RepID=A0A0R3WT64_HYDTA